MTNQFEEGRSQDRRLTAEQKVDEILAAITPMLKKPESLEIASVEVKRAVADPESFRFEVNQKLIDVESSLNGTRHQIQLTDKALNRVQGRLTTHSRNRAITKRAVNGQETEIDTIADNIERIEEEIEMIGVYDEVESITLEDGSVSTLSEEDTDKIIGMNTGRMYGTQDEDDDDQSGNPEDYFMELI